MANDKLILDDAQYQNFFRNLAEIVHADNRTNTEKRDALLVMVRDPENENREDDFANLQSFISWFMAERLQYDAERLTMIGLERYCDELIHA